MDAKLVITSFDELRKLIIEQFKNLSKQMESAKAAPTEQASPTVDTSQIKELIRNIPQPDLSCKRETRQPPIRSPATTKAPPHHRAKIVKSDRCIGLARCSTAQFDKL